MRRRSQAIGSAAVIGAVLAMSLASSASAAIPLTTSAYTATVLGDQVGTQVFTLAGGRKVECKTTHVKWMHTKKEAEAGELTLAPSFGECSADLLGVVFPVTVTTHNCKYLMRVTNTPPGEVVAEGWEYTGVAELVCPEGGIEIHAFESKLRHEQGISLCTYSIGSQGPLSSVDFKIAGAGKTLAIRARRGGIVVSRVSGGLVNCGEASQTGSYSGEVVTEAIDELGKSLTFAFN
jgi:hypothetical protein